jgi:hypothetical protein
LACKTLQLLAHALELSEHLQLPGIVLQLNQLQIQQQGSSAGSVNILWHATVQSQKHYQPLPNHVEHGGHHQLRAEKTGISFVLCGAAL